ncbi:MAG: bifunctional D-glycero-beta-D-manno-heptose-7-phosphate kinase/D-glycero-beta-D-manno-heptose 1-phosphate adenylyltransferase HldE [Acidobacteriaceae bacterium]
MIRDLHRVVELIENDWRNRHILVIGDVMLDRYIWGDVGRISPEAPVPVVRVTLKSDRAGGAGNVAMNVRGMGAKATLVGFCGDDVEREALDASLRDAGVTSALITIPDHPTTSKLRIIGGRQQMLRLDSEQVNGYPEGAHSVLLERVKSLMATVDAVVLSDYAKGVLTEDVCRKAIDWARRQGIPVLVDPKQKNFSRYRGATTVCPNLAELSTASGVTGGDLDAILAAGRRMVTDLELDFMTATMSEKGIALLKEDTTLVAPSVARQVFDVSGAGDTVIATFALCLAAGLEMEIAAQLANVSAGVVVGKVGTAPVTREELLMCLMPQMELQTEEKVLSLESLRGRVAAWRSAGEKIVFTNGCFDLLHVGHITLLEDARREGDRLVVAINTDLSVQRLKGPTRPVVKERERGRILAALAVVDAVVAFDEPTPLQLIEALRPDVIVKGGDYSENNVVGAREVRSWGGRVKIVPTVAGFSTTKLIADAAAPSRG